MLKEPPFDYSSEKGTVCVCLENGKYRAYLDRNAIKEFLLDLYWFSSTVFGEEISLSSLHCDELPCKGKPIGYCEFNLIPGHLHKKSGKTILKSPQTIRHKPHGTYTEAHDRLDYFVSPDEVEEAYEILLDFLKNANNLHGKREITLFGTLTVRLVGK